MNDKITAFLNLNFHNIHQNPRIWTSYTEFDEHPDFPIQTMTTLTKSHSNKDLAHIRIYFFDTDENIKIELYLISCYEWESFFEGYINSVNDLKFIMTCIGIPYN